MRLGLEIFPREQQTPDALGALVKADAEKWWPIIKGIGDQRRMIRGSVFSGNCQCLHGGCIELADGSALVSRL